MPACTPTVQPTSETPLHAPDLKTSALHQWLVPGQPRAASHERRMRQHSSSLQARTPAGGRQRSGSVEMMRRRGETPVLPARTVDSQARSRSPAWGECVRSWDRPLAHGPSWSVHGGLFPPGKRERPSLSGRREAIMSDNRPRLGRASVPSISVLPFHHTSYQDKSDVVQPIGNPNERIGTTVQPMRHAEGVKVARVTHRHRADTLPVHVGPDRGAHTE